MLFFLAESALKVRFVHCFPCLGPREMHVGFRAENANQSGNRQLHFLKKGKNSSGKCGLGRRSDFPTRQGDIARRPTRCGIKTGTAPGTTALAPFSAQVTSGSPPTTYNRQEILKKHAKMSSTPVIRCVRPLRVLICP